MMEELEDKARFLNCSVASQKDFEKILKFGHKLILSIIIKLVSSVGVRL